MRIEAERVEGGRGRLYAGEALRHVAMPLGGLGAGHVSLGGDGGLRQWQLCNQISHRAFVPDSFFAIRASSVEPPLNVVRVLQSEERLAMEEDHTPLVNDDYIPEEQRRLVERFGGVERTTFTGSYPFARVSYEDSRLPVAVDLESYTPFVPLDAEASSMPLAVFTFRVRNTWTHEVNGYVAAAQQNAVGWDGVSPINGNRCPLYGGNTNRVKRREDRISLVLENPSLADDHPGAGQIVLSALTPEAVAHERWVDPEHFIRFVEGRNPHPSPRVEGNFRAAGRFNGPVSPVGASPAGETYNSGLLAPYRLAPGEESCVSFVLAWHFPNRFLNFDQFGGRRDYGRSRFWIGNHYATRQADAEDAVESFVRERSYLEEKSREWEDVVQKSTLPGWMREALAAQGAALRSPTVFRAEDGKFYGFEGSLGESTSMSLGTHGGSCPLNCTHVWNYEQTLSRLFPDLERTMRETDLEEVQAPEGYIPHRTVLPLYLPQFRDEPIGGPTNPALDGMLGTILKVYREVRQGAGREWLDGLWPRVARLVRYIVEKWDPERDGVLEGEQPNTYDIAFYGPNMYIGGLWLAALRATEELAGITGDETLAAEVRDLFERGSARYDELLWNGEYYVQLPDPEGPQEDQFGQGCLSDQLFGQWWAHLLDLGYLLPEEHVKKTLASILKYNFREGFTDFEHEYRIFADRDDAGLLVCTWPLGGRPEVPVRYCDEVWTGIEYQVGAHCVMEGMVEEGMKVLRALRARYSGARRNPYNEIECGDHYVRAMAGWSALEAVSGFRYNALEDALSLRPATDELRCPFVTARGWGEFEWHSNESATLACRFGEVKVSTLSLPRDGEVAVYLARERLEVSEEDGGIRLQNPVTLREGERLEVVL